MPRHANFSAVASFRTGEVNRRLAAEFAKIGPFFFPLPQSINVGPDTVSFGGIASIAAPVFEFHPNPQDLITGHFAFFSTFTAGVNARSEKWKVRLDVSVTAHVFLGPQNGQITLNLDLSTVTFQPLVVTFLQGPQPPRVVIDALQSPQLAAAASSAVRRLGILPLAELAPSQLVYTQPGNFKESNFSVFNWFTVTLTVDRTELRVFEDAVTIAADFAGVTNGDRNALVDLTRTHGGGQIYLKENVYDDRYPNGVVPTRPEPTWYGESSDYALTFNLDVLRQIIEYQVSPQISGTPIRKEAVLNSVRVSYGNFNPDKDIAGPYFRRDDGLQFSLKVTAYGVEANVYIFLQPYWENGQWFLHVGRVDVRFPYWADILIGVAKFIALFLGVTIGFWASLVNPRGLFPLIRDMYDDIGNSFNEGDKSNIENQTRRVLTESARSAILPGARYISISPEGVEIISRGPLQFENRGGSLDVGFGRGDLKVGPLPVEQDGGATITPSGGWSVYDIRPIRTAVKLSPTWEKLNRNKLFVWWEVRRKDTNAVVTTGLLPYNQPGGNGVEIPHHSEELYLVTEYVIRCTITMLFLKQAGEIWSGQTTLKIDDGLDRTHPFVEWGPGLACFYNEGTDNKWWQRVTRSRIHRTAVGARCKYLRAAVLIRKDPTREPPFRYKDTLPFDWEDLNEHRKELCDYCFYGGPVKTIPYPREDWFDPNPAYLVKVRRMLNP